MLDLDATLGLDGHRLKPGSILAQDDLPLPGDPAPGGGGEGTAADGSSPPAPGGGADPLGGNIFLLVLLAVSALLIFSLFGQRRDKKKRDAMLSALRKHDRVQTAGGVIGTIVEVRTDEVDLKVDESSNTRITFARSAIQQVRPVAGAPGSLDAASRDEKS